jgi:hypothetical protein
LTPGPQTPKLGQMMPNMPSLTLAQSTAQPFRFPSDDDDWIDLSAVPAAHWLFIAERRSSTDHYCFGHNPVTFRGTFNVELTIYTIDGEEGEEGSRVMRVAFWKHKGSQATVVCWREFPLQKVPSPAAIPFLDWDCVGNSKVRCMAGDGEILLDLYARLMTQMLHKLQPTDRS